MPETTPPIIWYKNQRVWRTLFTQAVTLVTLAPTVLVIVNQQWPSELLAVGIVQALGVQAVLTKLMAIESVNAWLIRHTFLGSEPKTP